MNRKLSFAILFSLPLVLLLTGCSGGVAGEGSNTYPQTAGTPIIRANSFNDQGWVLIGKGQYESAISAFNSVLTDNPTEAELTEANNGLGWARSNLGSLSDGAPYFLQAYQGSHDAKVGLAAAYVQMASKTDLQKAIDILTKDLGGGNPLFKYTPQHNTGVTDAEVHAMLAYAYAGIGDISSAQDQIEHAKTLNPAWEGTTIDQLDKIVEFLAR